MKTNSSTFKLTGTNAVERSQSIFRHIRNAIFSLAIFLSFNFQLSAQSVLTGFVKDSDGQPVAGATVLIKGTDVFAVADTNGRFSIPAVKKPPYTLRISSVGFKYSELEVSDRTDFPLQVALKNDNVISEIVITARRREENSQEVPIPISIVKGSQVDDAGAFNVNRVKELIPSVQLYSSNPRNTTLNIRGLGSTFGLTNDGIDPGVGFYVDGVYYARPASTSLDFIDLEQIEVLRGSQGTLFGKNTTSGAFNIRTREASFTQGANFELSYGNYGYVQAKTSVTGPLAKNLAGRISFSGTQRDGLLQNVRTLQSVNDLNNLGVRGQLLYRPNENVKVTLSGDVTDQNPNGYAQLVAGVVTTKRSAHRQFNKIISDLGYKLPSENPFDRLVDHDATWKSGNQLGGVTLNGEFKIGPGTLTSTSAWRYWIWDPSNDRDFTGLQSLAKSQATSKHEQWSQEIRYAGEFSERLSGVVGVYALGQTLQSDPTQIEEAGADQWRFQQPSATGKDTLWKTPGLLNGYGIKTDLKLKSFSGAAFANIDWEVLKKVHLIPGIRYNIDEKTLNYKRTTYGGLQTTNKDLLKLKERVYSNQAFDADVSQGNLSGQITLAYRPSEKINLFSTYSTNFKPIGVNVGGLPVDDKGNVLDSLATIKPEYVTHYEVGVKTTYGKNATLNLVIHNTDIKDYQTLVQSPQVGLNRGYLSNAEKVRVWGIEVDGNLNVRKHISLYGSLAYTEGEYVKFTNAPVPLEETGGKDASGKEISFKDISGGALPGISKWAGSIGVELSSGNSKLIGLNGKFFLAVETFGRSSFSSSPSPSQYLNISGYALSNARIGFKASNGLSIFFWTRNSFNKNYFEQLLPAGGNAGHYAAVLGDQRTLGTTIRYSF